MVTITNRMVGRSSGTVMCRNLCQLLAPSIAAASCSITGTDCSPAILFVMVTTCVGYLQFFEEPFVMTLGGPLDSTISMSMFTYQQFGFGNYGFASATSYVLFVIIVCLSAVQFRFLRSNT